jgi:aromatic ring-opening dioxygenase catalytic subunit (LigB family)
MAQIVGGLGVPHTPVFPSHVVKKGPGCEEALLYGELARDLEAMRPDVVVLFSNDHFNTFFFDNFPMLSIGVAQQTSGPNDETEMPSYQVAVHEALADHARAQCILGGFDMAVTQEFTLDHAFMVPYHFLMGHGRTPVVPVFINGFSNPLPLAQRAYALGRTLRRAVESFPGDARVVAMGSGSFSLEIGGPLAPKGSRSGTPDRAWAAHVQARMEAAEIAQLMEEATGERLARAGNAAGELLNWLAMLGMVGGGAPTWMKPQAQHGHAYGVWKGDAR